ncbi:o-succinylbenzoate synthase [Namhaeicola litoreus]|uniref:o-succinylbenzoate synthase n=1 Tax=Namhaeicola litoreus TaxID=1052145 RepID=A0ABW3Y2F1_9FLAO
MSFTAWYQPYQLKFKRSAGTSRGILHTKETFFLVLENEDRFGIGECALFRGLSADDRPDYEEKLKWLCQHIHLPKDELLESLREFPSIQFGLEQALLSLKNQDPFLLFPSDFTQGKGGISINGLIWMGDKEYMLEQIKEKIEQGFSTLKLKIGAIDFQSELNLLNFIRNHFSKKEITLRVDANGAFSPTNALDKLNRLAVFDIHSIEQPIAVKQWKMMRELCKNSPIPIALDEELIGVFEKEQKGEVLEKIKPHFIILKPSLVGGAAGSAEWIDMAENMGIPFWITSALESNIGLNAIAQFTSTLNNSLPQGLGTGGLFTNNISSPLIVEKGQLLYLPDDKYNRWPQDLLTNIKKN